MINNILIFRTDKIGDLLISCPAIITIKKNLTSSKITLVTSKNNYEYAKTFSFIDNVEMFPDSSLVSKIKFVFSLSKKKFDYVLVLDGKDRSIISSIFIRSKLKVSIVSKRKINFFWKLLNLKYIIDDDSVNLITVHKNLLTHCNINNEIGNYDFLKDKIDNQFLSKLNIKKYIQIHLDEKWIKGLYIDSYKNIDPKFESFIDLIKNISKKNNLLITTGMTDFLLLDDLKSKFFEKKTDKIYYKKIQNYYVYLIYKPTLQDMESLMRSAEIFISCHAGIVHAANSFGNKIIDIIDENRKDWYSRWSAHFKNYTLIYRNEFNILKKELLNLIDN